MKQVKMKHPVIINSEKRKTNSSLHNVAPDAISLCGKNLFTAEWYREDLLSEILHRTP